MATLQDLFFHCDSVTDINTCFRAWSFSRAGIYFIVGATSHGCEISDVKSGEILIVCFPKALILQFVYVNNTPFCLLALYL